MAAIAGGSQLFQPFNAGAVVTNLAPSAASCSNDSGTDDDPAACAATAATLTSNDGTSANVETDDSGGGTGDDDLSVTFAVPASAASAISIELRVWATQSDDPGQLKAGSNGGGSDSVYGSLALGAPATYTNAALTAAVQGAAGGNFTVNLSMNCIPNANDCGALVNMVQLSFDTQADADGDGVADGADQCASTPATPADRFISTGTYAGCSWAQALVLADGTQANPARPAQCGIHFSLVLDKTGSFSTTEREDTEDAAKVFVTNILGADPTATFSVTSFANATSSLDLAGPSSDETAIHTALENGITGGSTNWAAGMNTGNVAGIEWMIVFTDGNPNEPGGPGNNAVDFDSVLAAYQAANNVKDNPTHLTIIGINTTGNAPAGFNAELANLMSDDVMVGGITDLASILASISSACEPDTGNIYLDKVAANADPAGTEFALLIDGAVKANNSHAEAYEGPFSTNAGTVVVQEELLAGYAYGGVVCHLGAPDGSVVTTSENNSGGANRRGVQFTLAADTNVYCQFTNRLLPPDEITINAYKIVCESEADLPNWGDGGSDITATTAATFVENSEGDCWFVDGWAFEWSDGDVVDTSPGDNLDNTALADFTTTTSASDNNVPSQTPASVTIDISEYDKLWVREKKPAGYLAFSSDTTAPRDNVSAEFYCSADVINYDNWERIEDTSGAHDLTAGTTYNCVAFNVELQRDGFVKVHKIVTNVVDDTTPFDFSFPSPATNFTVVEGTPETRSIAAGPQVVTEAPEDGYTTLGWARIFGGEICPAAMPTSNSFPVINYGTDNTAEINVDGITYELCFYNELDRGDITVEKYVWDGDSWEPHVAPAPFTFDINPIADIVPVHDNVGPGTYQVPAGEYAVIENLPVSGYEFVAIFEGDEVCPDSPFPNDPAQVLADPFVNVDVPGGGDVLVCAYNAPVGRLIINKVNTTNDGPFTFDIDLDGGNFDTAVGGAAAGLTEVYNQVVPLGEYTVTELGVGTFDQCPTTPGVEQIFQLNPSPVQSLTAAGQTITFTIINEECPVLLGTGTLVVEKYLDLNGIPGAEDTPLNWSVTVTGPEFPGGQVFQLDGTGDSPSVGVLFLPGIAVGPYTVTEATPSSYIQTGLFVNGIDMGINDTAGVVVALDETETVEFYNQPTGTVRVEKSTYVSGVAVDDRGGWTVTVAGCGYFAAGVTNASGVVIFDDVPACANVTVQEDPNSKPGYTPTSGAAKVVSVTPNNTTVVTFRNEKNPPCIDCGPTPTPSTPTSTPTVTPTATPTGTQPAGDTPTPTPTESVAGEITPGTGAEATPIAPSAGSGTAGATSAIAMMLMVLGLFAISSGTTILAVARRRK